MASLRLVLSFSAFSVFLPFISIPLGAQAPSSHGIAPNRHDRTLPLVFERNEGQLADGIGFLGRTQHYSVAVSAQDLRFSLPGAHTTSSVVLSFAGGDAAQPMGMTQAPFLTNYYMGRDPKQQRTGIRNYSRIGLSHVYPGIDAQFYAQGETIEHDFYVAPGGDVTAIAMRVSGSDKVTLNAQGEVLIPSEVGELRLKKPVAYQVDGQGRHVEVAAAFELSKANSGSELRFRLGAYDHGRELVIDPEIVYATYFGGTAGSTAAAIASDTTGNIYLTGSTTSAVADFGVTGANSYTGAAGAATSVFVAKFNATANGSAVGWLTYIGSSSGVSQSTSIATPSSGGALVFVGGTTAANDFPTTAGTFQATATSVATHGFVLSLLGVNGALSAATYVDSNPAAPAATAVNALATDSLGNVLLAGSAAGNALPVSTDAIAVDATVLASTALKGFIVRLDGSLVTEGFGTYLMGSAPGDTSITSVAVDTLSNIYVGGYTAGTFPYAGTYNSSMMFAHNATDTGYDSFAAQVIPGGSGATTLGYSAWFAGTGADQLNAVALDASGNLVLFGQTASGDLLSEISYTSAGMSPITATPVTVSGGVTTAIPATAPATTSGFVMTLNTTGMATAATYVGGTGNDSVKAGGLDGAGAVYAAGTSNSSEAMSYSSASQLPIGQDRTTSNVQHGFVLQLANNLAAVNYIANIGGSVGPDSVVGVALDGAKNAYVAGNVAAASLAYTSYTAYQQANPGLAAGAASAYVAKITHSPNSSQLTLTATTTGTGTPDPIGYVTGQTQNVTYTWTLTSAATVPPVNLTVQIPVQQYLTYNTIKITDTTTATDLPSGTCSLTASGASCLIAVFPQTAGVGDSLNVVLGTTLNAAPTTSTLTLTATVFGPGSDSISTSEISNVVPPSSLTLTGATDTPGATVNTTATGVSGPNTQASYTFTLANATGAGQGNNVSFTITALPTGFVSGSFTLSGTATVPPGSCTVTGCTGLTIAAGNNVVFKLVGTYLDSALGGAATVPAAGQFAANASAFLSNPTATLTPSTTLQRGVHLTVTGALSAPPTGQTAFNLGDSMTYAVKVVNSGPSTTSGSDVLTVTLPSGFTASSSTGYTCGNGTPVTCTLNIPATAAGANVTYPISGSFVDNAGNATVGATAVTKTFAATVALSGDFESGTTGTDYNTSVGTTVVRTAALTLSNAGANLVVPATVCGGGSARCLYMLNTADVGDKVAYSFTVSNAGPNVSVGTAITIQLPFAPANPAGTAHPLNAGVPVYTIAAPGFGTTLQCSYTLATNQIVCSGGNLPVGTTALTITGTATIDANTVPAAATFVSTAAAAGSVAITQSAVGAPANVTLSTIEVDRAAHLVTTKTVVASGTTPAAPINLDENKPSLTPGVNDTVTATVSVGNTGLNNAPSVTLTDTLPPYFRLITVPAVAANCTVGGAALTTNYTTGATAATVSCALGTLTAGTSTASSSGTAAVVGTPNVTFTYSGKFVDNGANADVTGTLAAKVKQLSVNFGSAVATTAVAVDPLTASDATSAATSFTVARSAHFLLRKTRNTTVAVVPTTFTDTTDLNLDEKTTATKFGVNDEVEYDLTLANGGRNSALGVQFTDTLPTYFTLVNAYAVAGASLTPDTGANGVPVNQLAAGSLVCYAGAAASGTPLTLPFSTGAARQQITCSYGTATAPLALAAGPSTPSSFNAATAIQFVYQGKYQDNAPGADNIGAGVSTALITSAAGEAVGLASLAVDPGPVADGSSAALASYTIQRAAHLKLMSAPLQLLTNETPLTSGGVGVPPIIAQAEPSAGGGTPVFNCLRYKVYIQNSGPNIARQPQLTFAAPAGLKLTSAPTGMTSTPGSDAPLPSSCAYGATISSTTVTGAAALPLSQTPGAALVVDADGYFDLNTLTLGNSLTLASTISYTALSDTGIQDSLKAMPFTTVNGPSVTVVNTPSGSNFIVQPFSTTGTRTTRVTFGTIATPGVTSESISSDGPPLPSGPSPDPRDNKKTITLYRAGTGVANFYKLGTTAVPVGGANVTTVCVANATAGTALTDFFAKPERVLLWSLLNTPSGTTFRTVPNVTAPVSGDITTLVTPLSGTSYVQAGGTALPYTSFSNFPGPQSQPAMVCGQLNGFATAGTLVTLAVLEPVNFAPFTVPNPATVSPTPGKGVSEVSFQFPTTHDYNDNDPCYIASSTSGPATRQSCDDNLVLTTWIFGGETLVPSQSHIVGPLPTAQGLAFVTNPVPYGIQGGATIYDLVADQLAVPVYRAANFCDPGNAPGSYSPVSVPTPCPISTAALSGTPPQETVFGSAQIAQLTPGISGGSSGLTILPPATTPTSATTTVLTGYTAASAVVTAGQTTGFQWKLGDVVPTTGDTYTLSCYGVDAATQNVVTALPAGISCQIAPSITFPPNFTQLTAPANPAIYVVTSGTLARNTVPASGPVWKTISGGVMVALLLPLMAVRRRYPKRFGLLMLLLLLGGGMGLSGCGTSASTTVSPVGTTPGTYYFRASGTSIKGAGTFTSTAFSVKVVAGI